MKITKHTDYALRVLIYLATHAGSRSRTQRIAESHKISLHHLQKIVRELGELGYILLHRGVGGGLELALPPAEVSIGEVVRQLDDSRALVECFRPETSGCVIAPACQLKRALAVAQEAFYADLDPLTLADIVRGRRGAALRALTDAE